MSNNKLKYIIYVNSILLTFLLIIHVYTIFNVNFNYETTVFNREHILMIISVIFQGILALSVVLAYNKYRLKRKRQNEEGLKLKLNIQEKRESDLLLLKTEVSNDTSKNIEVKSAFLLISLHNKDIVEYLNEKLQLKIKSSNDIVNHIDLLSHQLCNNTINERVIFVSLDYYYKENIVVGNETLRYVHPIVCSFEKIDSKIWDVRFFVFPKIGKHRSVHSCFSGYLNL